MSREDQQEIDLEFETDLAWFAGILDGEGTIQMTVPQSKKSRQQRCVNVWIEINNCDANIINKCIDVLDKLKVGHYDGQKAIKPIYKEDGTCYISTKKICLFTRIAKLQNIKIVLEAIRPYLVGYKKAMCKMMLRFVNRRLKTGRKPYEMEDLIIAQDFFKQSDGRFASRNIEILDKILRDFTPNDPSIKD